VLESLLLTELAGRPPGETSLGNGSAPRSPAVVVEPKLLLADEPTSHQDAASARRVVEVLRHRAEVGGGVLVATHEEMLVDAADRVVTSTTTDRQVPVSRRTPARERVGERSALPRDVEGCAVVDGGAHDRQPSVTFTPSSNASSFIGAWPWS
jgi:ABC-type Na+ transport system ATPase subunit NatA